VGFIDSPLKIVQKLDHSKSDIFVQVRCGCVEPLEVVRSCFVFFASLTCKTVCSILQFLLAQKDMAFVMNRSVVGWRTWYTTPQANIGRYGLVGIGWLTKSIVMYSFSSFLCANATL
jgi:hypothetical protein